MYGIGEEQNATFGLGLGDDLVVERATTQLEACAPLLKSKSMLIFGINRLFK